MIENKFLYRLKIIARFFSLITIIFILSLLFCPDFKGNLIQNQCSSALAGFIISFGFITIVLFIIYYIEYKKCSEQPLLSPNVTYIQPLVEIERQ